MAGIRIVFQRPVFPVNSVKAMRGCVALADDTPRMLRFARAVFEAYWGEQRDISQDAELSAVSARAGIDPAWLFEAIAQPAVKALPKANTDLLLKQANAKAIVCDEINEYSVPRYTTSEIEEKEANYMQ